MSLEAEGFSQKRPLHMLRGPMATLAVLVVARFALEVAGVPHGLSRYVSSNVGLLFAAIYVAAVGPLRGRLRTFSEHLVPAAVLAIWTEAWIIAATIVSAVLRLSRSHFAGPEDFHSWRHLGRHVFGHTVEAGMLFLIILLLMAVVHFLWRWPLVVAPGALLGVFVIMRFWTEAMGLGPLRTAAWSSTILVLLSAFYLGGVGALMGYTRTRQLLVPSLVIGWTWRLWVYLATLFAAAMPSFNTHFFNPTRGDVFPRLVRALWQCAIEGFLAGLLVWVISAWMARAVRPPAHSSSEE